MSTPENVESEVEPHEKENLRVIFNVFDPSEKGCVPVDRIGSVIRAAGECPTEATVDELIARYRAIGDEVNFDQFVSAMVEVRQKHKKPSKAEIDAAFRVFGTAPYITISELKKILTQFGEKLSDDEIDRLVALVGTTEDGRIDKDEMAARLTS